MTALEKVLAETQRYEHPLPEFPARERDGAVELVIALRNPAHGLHTYRAPVHPRDIDHPRFPYRDAA